VALIALLLSATAAVSQPRVAAVLTSVAGSVTLGEPVRRAADRQQVNAGEVIHVAPEGRAVLLCSTDRWIEIRGPADWALSAAACARGRAVPSGLYDTVAVEHGHIRFVGASGAIELDTRGDADPDVPIVLSPRNTTLAEQRPVVVWTKVPGAVQYEIEWVGAGMAPLKVAAGEAACGAGTGVWRGEKICSLPFPADRLLPSGPLPLFLHIGARLALAAPLRSEQQGVKVVIANDAARDALRERLAAIEALPADALTRQLLIAGTYASRGFTSDALKLYDSALAQKDDSVVRVTLADIAASSGLYAVADREYRHVVEAMGDPEAQATAEAGLGRVAFALHLYSAARDHFDQASRMYAAIGLAVAADAARTNAERAAGRIPR